MNKIHTDLCPVCNNGDTKESLICQDYLVTNELFSIYQCPECGFSFTQDFPSENEIGIYYDAPEYISHSDTDKGLINSLYHMARNISLKSKTKLILKYTNIGKGKLLDIGTGTGYFLHAMCKKSWIVTGIEKSEATRTYAHKKFGLNIQDSDYLFEIPDKTKDAITMWHVLEHIEKLNPTLANLHRILKDNGTLFIALPNKSSFDANHYGKYWAAYDVPRHLWHFSPSDFQRIANKHNFEVIEMKRMNFDPFYISMLSEQNKGTSLGNIIGLFKGSLFFIKSLLNKEKSSSLIYILRKK
ncbi:MAG: class I SAM-dependent methyltransferase [Dysgonomonas sp.]|nr:class I SAM-dependent methyltransferase [Dysgonomonas sp.]